MGTFGAPTGLHFLRRLLRGLQLAAAAAVLAIYAYFLATLAARPPRGLAVPTSAMAVGGIAAAAALHALLGILLVRGCCCAASSVALVLLDAALAAAFVYVAVANWHGGGPCRPGPVQTLFGAGEADATPGPGPGPGGGGDGEGGGGAVAGRIGLPTFGTACQLEFVCLVFACVSV